MNRVGVILKRGPLILPKPSQFERSYLAYKEAVARQDSIQIDPNFFFKKGTTNESIFFKNTNQITEEGSKDYLFGGLCKIPELQHDEIKLLEESMSKGNASLFKEVAKYGHKSLNRHLTKNLYLTVKLSPSAKWTFPQSDVNSGELLHEAADRLLKEKYGDAKDTWIVGKTPASHFASSPEEKVFFMKAQILAGQVTLVDKKVSDFEWNTKDEISEKFDPEYYQSIKDSLA